LFIYSHGNTIASKIKIVVIEKIKLKILPIKGYFILKKASIFLSIVRYSK